MALYTYFFKEDEPVLLSAHQCRVSSHSRKDVMSANESVKHVHTSALLR